MAAGPTYEPIQTQTLTSNTGTVTFHTIGGSYTDLVLIAARRYSNIGTGADNTFIRFNSDSGTNYSTTYLTNGPSTGRITNANNLYTSAGGNEIADRFSVDVWNIMNYSNTTTYKTSTLRMHFGATNMLQHWVGLWRNTAAITRIDILGSGGTFAIGSTFTLYGIAAA